MPRESSILFYVQHLLGIGHLVRACRIAAELARDSRVTLLIGGTVPEGLLPAGVEVVFLPPVKAGPAGFSSLVDAAGEPFGREAQAIRRDLLLAHFDRIAPDLLLIEAFPFGRRQMRFELVPLLERAGARPTPPLIVSSIRDILQQTKPERQAETLALVDRWFDAVLVHGDPAFAPLDASFPAARAFAGKIRYTGIVGPPAAAPTDLAAETFDVVVSVGGGAVGAALVATACAARPATVFAAARWLVLTGPNLPETARPTPGTQAEGLVLRDFVPNLAAVLARARLSVSQAGYNTVADVMAAGCRAVLVPFAAAGETEQSRRACLLEAAGRAVVVAEDRLDPAKLAAAIDRAARLEPPRVGDAARGAARTATILGDLIAARRQETERAGPWLRRPGAFSPKATPLDPAKG